jgi:tellurite resistance protein TerA
MPIHLQKITLEKQGDSHRIDLTKRSSGGSPEIVINLNWSKQGSVKKGFFSKLFADNSDIDLDLGCFWQLRDGATTEASSSADTEATKREVQDLIQRGQVELAMTLMRKKQGPRGRNKSVLDALQFAHDCGGPRNMLTHQGCYTQRPWVWHTGDDRSGAGTEGENILVNPDGMGDLKRILVYSSIYEGVARWAETNAIVTIKVPDNPDIVVEMGKQTHPRKFCAIADITFDGNGCMTVKKLVSFHNAHEDCDRIYGWGMQWQAGSK